MIKGHGGGDLGTPSASAGYFEVSALIRLGEKVGKNGPFLAVGIAPAKEVYCIENLGGNGGASRWFPCYRNLNIAPPLDVGGVISAGLANVGSQKRWTLQIRYTHGFSTMPLAPGSRNRMLSTILSYSLRS